MIVEVDVKIRLVLVIVALALALAPGAAAGFSDGSDAVPVCPTGFSWGGDED